MVEAQQSDCLSPCPLQADGCFWMTDGRHASIEPVIPQSVHSRICNWQNRIQTKGAKSVDEITKGSIYALKLMRQPWAVL